MTERANAGRLNRTGRWGRVLFIDWHDGDRCWGIYDEADGGAEAYGPFATYGEAVAKLNAVYNESKGDTA